MDFAEAVVLDMTMGKYQAPGQSALFKGIPMEVYDHPVMVRFRRNRGLCARFRGPRRPGSVGKRMCLKEHAVTFSLYKY